MDVGRHSAGRWGLNRAEPYLASLQRAFDHLAEFPEAGRRVDDLRTGYFRFETGRHVAFHRKTDTGILIVRVLHRRMLAPGRLDDA